MSPTITEDLFILNAASSKRLALSKATELFSMPTHYFLCYIPSLRTGFLGQMKIIISIHQYHILEGFRLSR